MFNPTLYLHEMAVSKNRIVPLEDVFEFTIKAELLSYSKLEQDFFAFTIKVGLCPNSAYMRLLLPRLEVQYVFIGDR